MSQSVTEPSDSITFISTKHLSLMVKDLEEGDKCRQEISLVKENLTLCETKTTQMDSLLSIAATKEALYKEDISNYESLLSFKDKRIQDLNTEVGKLKRSRKALSIGGSIFILAILFL